MPAPPPIIPDRSRRDWTVEQLAALPEDGNRYEVVEGELLVSPSPSLLHQDAVAELFVALRDFARRNGLHCVLAPAELVLSSTSAVQPDIFATPFVNGVRPSHLADIRHLALVVEVLSPSSVRADRLVKRRLYQREGIAEYWIVDAANRVIERWRPGMDVPDVLAESLVWSPTPDVEPLAIDLVAYFRRVHGEDVAKG